MGCAQSRIENEEAVSRCKDRRQFMRDAVACRNAFAAAHSAYTVSLKNTGAALSDLAHSDLPETRPSAAGGAAGASSSSAAPPPPPPIESLPPPPPPLPDFSPTPPLQRSVSLPDLPKKFTKKPPNADPTIEEAEEEVEGGGGGDGGGDPATPAPPPPPSGGTWDYFFDYSGMPPGPTLSEIRPEGEEVEHPEPPVTPEKVAVETPPPPPAKAVKKQKAGVVHHQHAASAPAVETVAKKGKAVALAAGTSASLLQVLKDLDDYFLKASESAHEVSKMLEANRMHYHSNFADNRGHIDHSARVMRVITWNRSFKGMPNADDGKDDFDNDEWETHASVLDKMLAWEKKLYDEVKAGELMKIEYQRKVALLNKQKKRGANPEAIEKTKAAVSHLHTRYIVDMQSMDSTVSEIQRLRDDQLYPKLVDLVDGMAKMWETMHAHHGSQLKITDHLRALDISSTPKETSENHYNSMEQLHNVVREWHSQFQKLFTHQKEYIQNLSSWLKLNLIPIESSLKEKVSSPPRVLQPPIQPLLLSWHEHMEKLPDDLAKSAITSFAAVLNTIMLLQQDELKQKEKCEETRKELARKTRAFEDWYHKYSQRRAAAGEEAEGENNAEGVVTSQKDPVLEKKFAVDSVKTRLDDELEAHQKLCRQVREKLLGSLKTHLPELFRAMSDFALASSEMYKRLNSLSRPGNAAAH